MGWNSLNLGHGVSPYRRNVDVLFKVTPERLVMSVWLASGSDRRFSILSKLLADLHASPLEGVNESPPSGDVRHQVLSICRRKAKAVPSNHGHDYVVVADTLVGDPDDPNAAMGQPEDAAQALAMLKRLSGARHQVWSATGVCLLGDWTFFVESAVVEFKELTVENLRSLIDSGSWKGKAGGYDLAGQMSEFASLVEGDELTVLGFAPAALRLLN